LHNVATGKGIGNRSILGAFLAQKLSYLEIISVGFSEWKVDAARTTKATKLWDGNLRDTALPTNGANCDLQFESTTIDNSSKTFPLKR